MLLLMGLGLVYLLRNALYYHSRLAIAKVAEKVGMSLRRRATHRVAPTCHGLIFVRRGDSVSRPPLLIFGGRHFPAYPRP